MNVDVTSLRDYPALEQLSRALWRRGSGRGAAVLIGAGLSKNAVLSAPDSPPPPLWWELLEVMSKQLYPHDPSRAPTDSLRIAEEYRTYFGQAALDEFIRSRFPDQAWSPGILHTTLLNLPWTDVLTTNWDTLLERAAEQISNFRYELVRTQSDLTYARSPRIVKLHGTIGDTGPLIFTEEDFRSYPAKYAAFVNFARQVFIENELCLLGFSGTDPNFLKWAGWVRDHLGNSAHRIYLVGNLRLEDASRRYLEARNIAPIDFAPLVKQFSPRDQHNHATEVFLDFLKRSKPSAIHVWRRSPPDAFPINSTRPDDHARVLKDDSLALAMLTKTYAVLKAEKASYPGWHICPERNRRMNSGIGGIHWLFRGPVLRQVPDTGRAEMIRVILWHYEIGFLPLEARCFNAILELLDDQSISLPSAIRLEFTTALYRSARLAGDQRNLAEVDARLKSLAGEESTDILTNYQRCIFALDQLDMASVKAGLSLLTSCEPIWLLRRSSLTAELGDYQEAGRLLSAAVNELEQRLRVNRDSLAIKSLLAWALWLSRAYADRITQDDDVGVRLSEYRELDIDPRSEIERFASDAIALEKKLREDADSVRPSFEPGTFKDSSTQIVFSKYDPARKLLFDFESLVDSVGIPLRLNSFDICASEAIAVFRVNYQPSLSWYCGILRALHSTSDLAFEKYFSRIAIARLDDQTVSAIVDKIDGAIAFWAVRLKENADSTVLPSRSNAIDVLRLLTHALSRFAVRMRETMAKSTFYRALSCAKNPDFRHPWLIEAFGHLAKYAAGSLTSKALSDIAFEVIEFPLRSEQPSLGDNFSKLIEIIWGGTPERDHQNLRLNARISQLLEHAKNGSRGREEALLRLAFLHIRSLLTTEEVSSFGESLWSTDLDEHGLPTNTDLTLTTLALLPAPAQVDVQARLSKLLFATNIKDVMAFQPIGDTRQLSDRHALMASLININFAGLKLDPLNASRMFDELVHWRRYVPDGRDPMEVAVATEFDSRIAIGAGELLTNVVVPSIDKIQCTSDRLQRLLSFIDEARSWPGLAAAILFLERNYPSIPAPIVARVEVIIRRGLISSEPWQIHGAAIALTRWANATNASNDIPLPRALIEALLTTLESCRETGLQALLRCARELLELDIFETSDVDRLTMILDTCQLQFDYQNIEIGSRRAISASLVRAECVRLASSLRPARSEMVGVCYWLKAAESDPLPEVRHCLQ